MFSSIEIASEFRPVREVSVEQRILQAVLLRGVLDALGENHVAGDAQATRERGLCWVMSEENGPGSFADACAATGRDPGRTRKEIISGRAKERVDAMGRLCR